ncbi:MAG: hypothetical protein ABII71_01270 [Candidatus Micrarchaeota archaeon]
MSNNAVSMPIKLKERVLPGRQQGVKFHENKRFLGIGKGSLYKETMAARAFVDANRNERPFQDREGYVEDLADRVQERARNRQAKVREKTGIELNMDNLVLEEIVSMCTPHPVVLVQNYTAGGVDRTEDERLFLENSYTLPPAEDPPTAGSILTQQEQRYGGIVTMSGDETICLVERVEAYIVAIALLRKFDFQANLANLIDNSGVKKGIPPIRSLGIAITDDSIGSPLCTFALEEHVPGYPGVHPEATEVEILSDQAVYAITLCLKAEIRVRSIMNGIGKRLLEGEDKGLTPDEEDEAIRSLGDLFVEADNEWHFSPDVIGGVTAFYMRFHEFIEEVSSPNTTMDMIFATAREKALEKTMLIVARIKELGAQLKDEGIRNLGKTIEVEVNATHQDAILMGNRRLDEMRAQQAMIEQMMRERGLSR